jgi:hypothetical protein
MYAASRFRPRHDATAIHRHGCQTGRLDDGLENALDFGLVAALTAGQAES